MGDNPPYYAVMLNMQDKPCLIVGAGTVAERKAIRLIQCGARITVVSPSCTKTFADWSESRQIVLHSRPYSPDDLQNVVMVFACASDPVVNRRVCKDARQLGVWVNSADDFEQGDFMVPAQASRGKLQLAVSTSGASPALAKSIVSKLRTEYGEEYEEYTRLLYEFRKQVLLRVRDSKYREILLKKAAEDRRLLEWICADRKEEARALCFSFLED